MFKRSIRDMFLVISSAPLAAYPKSTFVCPTPVVIVIVVVAMARVLWLAQLPRLFTVS